MKSNSKKGLNSPYPYFLNDAKKNFWLVVGVCIYVTAFIFVFHPAPFQQFAKIGLIIAITFAVLLSGINLTPKIYPTYFETGEWTLKKHLLFTTLLLAIIGTVISILYYLLHLYPGETFTTLLLHDYLKVIEYGVIPLTIVTIIMRNTMLRENLKNALLANKELDRIKEMKAHAQQLATCGSIIIYSDTSETLQFNIKELLFAQAEDNYATFFWKENGVVKNKLLRMNLKSAESQFTNSFIIRCHRSYLINVLAIASITGNANGYKLSVNGSEIEIPVSRLKGKEVIEKIEQARSLIELE